MNNIVTPSPKFPEMVVANWQKFKLSLNDGAALKKVSKYKRQIFDSDAFKMSLFQQPLKVRCCFKRKLDANFNVNSAVKSSYFTPLPLIKRNPKNQGPEKPEVYKKKTPF
jgi:hypothetical protein